MAGNPYHDAKGLFTTAAGDADGKAQANFKSMIKEGMAQDKGPQTKFQKFLQQRRAERAKEQAKAAKIERQSKPMSLELRNQAKTLLTESQRAGREAQREIDKFRASGRARTREELARLNTTGSFSKRK